MIDLGGFPVLDVVIGLTFLYFVLSIVCSSISEILASVFKLRARNLETGVRALLGSKDAADQFFDHWRIKALGTPKWRDGDKVEKSRKPSYVPPRTVSLVILDTFAPAAAAEAAKADPTQAPPADLLEKIGDKVEHLPDSGARTWLATILVEARGDVDRARAKLEEGFNDVMDRATGWYKRKVQIILFCISVAIAAGLNADTLNVADRLARDDAVRAQVVGQALKAAPAKPIVNPTTADVEEQIEAARATALPLGWGEENVANGKTGWVVLQKVAGLTMTAFALMLGAPFWFDVLGRFARLRSTGNRVGTPKDDQTASSDRDDRLKRTALPIEPRPPTG